MAEKRQSYDAEFREGAVRIVTETGKTIAQVAADLGIKETTLGSWVARARRAGGDGTLGELEREELVRLRRESVEGTKTRVERAPAGAGDFKNLIREVDGSPKDWFVCLGPDGVNYTKAEVTG
jgi:transposase